ncbi:MAG: hypothetical protein A2V67_19190 [Deltaproteobacteria bacterium RBG_13_61_14]|nr:MAG: hypothetical protein A2V67_19190 [Deltaproteobacteria bacterium RBG_13_61_14]
MHRILRLGLMILCVVSLVPALALGRRGRGEHREKDKGPKKFQRALTLTDVAPQLDSLAGTRSDPFEKEQVYFGEVGMPAYDEVCMHAAVAYGSLKVAQTMLADAQENLVKYAKDHVARGEAKRQLQELKQETQVAEMAPPPGTESGPAPAEASTASPAGEPAAEPEWTPEEAAYVIKEAKRQKGQFTRDEITYFATMSVNLAVAGYVLGKGVQSEVELGRQIPDLIGSAREDFRGPDALKIPFVLQNLNQARKHLQALPGEGKRTAIDLAKYAAIVKELHEETKDLTPVD